MSGHKLLICVVGPTAIGKTALAAALARYFDTEVLSADSRQFYSEMSIGTAVPSTNEMSGIPHHFIQHISIHEDYNVGEFEKDAIEKLDALFQEKDKVIMVGGSGLYIDAVVRGLDDFPKISKKIRRDLREELNQNGLDVLLQELKKNDPVTFSTIDRHNHQRVLRALEVFRSSGKPISSFWGQNRPERSFKTIFIGLTADRKTIYRRIEERVDRMLSSGLEEEALSLHEHSNLNALQTVGYRELFAYFEGALSREEAIAEIKKNSRRFAKRQSTWFKKNPSIHWFDYRTPPDEIAAHIKKGGKKPPNNT